MDLQFFLAFVVIILSIPTHGAENFGETYWKMNMGNDITMPKVLKETLSVGAGTNKNYEAQPFSRIIDGTRGSKNDETNSASVYGQSISKILNGAISTAGRPLYSAKGSKLATDNSIVYFFEENLAHPGSMIKLHFLMSAREVKFIPSKLSNSIPFSSDKLSEILQFFAVSPKSQPGKLIERTIALCEETPLKGEQKDCATSLEAMVDYAKSRLGNNIKAFSTEVETTKVKQEYKIENAKKINEKNLVCHKFVYPYAVFYCHTLTKTDVYEVSLIDGTGKNVKAVAVCHKDTSSWYPGHIAFKILKVKPGGVPICHFLNPNAVLWVTK